MSHVNGLLRLFTGCALTGLLLAGCGATPAPAGQDAASSTSVPNMVEPGQSTSVPASGTTESPASATVGAQLTIPPVEDSTATAVVDRDETSPATCGPEGAEASCLRLAYRAEPDSADPQKVSFVNEVAIVSMNFLPLMRFDPQTLQPEPGAAQSVDVSADGRTLTFHLRPNQTYSDGAPLTAANFEYAWKRLCDPTVAGEYTSIVFPLEGCEAYYTAFDTGGLTITDRAGLQELRDQVGATALDPNTFRLSLREPAPYFLNVAALWVGAPTREDMVEQGGDTWWSSVDTYIGNGPFQLTEWEPQGRMHWTKNTHYAVTEHAAAFEASEWTFVADSRVAFLAYQSGEIDMTAISAEDLPVIEADPRLKAQRVEQGSQCTFRLDFNLTQQPFDDVRVRQGFAYALDREGFVRDILHNMGKPAYSFIPPGFPGHDPSSTSFKYDPTRAKQLLQEAGFDFSQEIVLPYAASPRNNPRYEYLAASLQQALGVKIRLNPEDPTSFTARFKDLATVPPLFVLGWCSSYPDPQDWLSTVYKTGGVAAAVVGFSDAAYDALIDKADLLRLDDPERLRTYQQAQEMLVSQLTPSAMFWHDAASFLVQPWIKGVEPNAIDPSFPGFYSLDTITIATE